MSNSLCTSFTEAWSQFCH